MASYTQTLLMPLPKQHLRDMRSEPMGRGYRNSEFRNRRSEEINSILSYYD